MEYLQTNKNFSIKGKLKRTDRKIKPIGSSKKFLYADMDGQLFAKIFGYWWKFPEQIEY